MPRSKTGQKRPAISQNNMTAAVKSILEGRLSLREAEKEFSVSKSTLARHIQSHKASGADEFIYSKKNYVKKIFSNYEEEELADYLKQAARLHYGLTKNEVKSLAFQYAKSNAKQYPETWNETEKAGNEWLRGFLKRQPFLSLRKPESTSLARSTSFNKATVSEFFFNLKKVLTRDSSPPEKIYNLDETGNLTVHIPPKIIAPKCIKQIGSMTSGERGINITMIAAVNAIGNYAAPMLIFPCVHVRNHMLKGAPTGPIGGANPSGWSNEVLFLQYIEHFINQVKP